MKCTLILFGILVSMTINWTECLKLAEPCIPTVCKLPNCKCSTIESGSGIPTSKIPQIVLLTFDDATTGQTYGKFSEALFNRKNPDGCPIAATHFLSHEYTDYTLVHDLWLKGHEVALHSITHAPIQDYWLKINLTTFKAEFDDMRQIVMHFAGIPKSDIRGARLPFLQTSGNISFQGLKELGLVYDSSMPTIRYVDNPLWPYTLEYASHQDCMIEPCPTASFPNVWEVPMTMWLDEKNVSCSMVDACTNIPKQAEPLSKWIIKQFERHYNNSRAPFPVFMHAAWFLRSDEYFKAYKLFIDHLVRLPDVYLVTVNKAIEWVKNPKSLDVKKPFGECEVRKPTFDCFPRTCKLTGIDGNERWMSSCVKTCPDRYPWIHNPLGK
ncbi:chitin deacetylase 8 [Cotesia glomerata]|uniref:NodB homology domain-containing protein n=1 Tax=Cotesia glomerata TaxID=32391 RepID=A0AAV7J9M9_COTGL|nr:chitin deacetylase 8 [Cotesia glomerata]KAH0568506.1 hypothetical protein KQX54_021099 [Cotesia glomerata]